MNRRIPIAACLGLAALPLMHPFGPVRKANAADELTGVPQAAVSCENCHSERTRWPAYSYVPGVSWLVEKDVAEAREHMNWSHWAEYSNDRKRDLLARMAAEVRNRRMPPARYTALHPEARLSGDDVQKILEWTKLQRRYLRSQEIKQGAAGIKQQAAESKSMLNDGPSFQHAVAIQQRRDSGASQNGTGEETSAVRADRRSSSERGL